MEDALAELDLDQLKALEQDLLQGLIEQAKGGDIHAVRMLATHIERAKSSVKERRRTGRRSSFTPELASGFVEAIRGGASDKIACDLFGIHPSTLYKWQQKADRQRELLRAQAITEGLDPDEYEVEGDSLIAFFDDIARAKSAMHQELLDDMRRQSREGNMRASAWLLERKFPKVYHPGAQRVDVSLEINAEAEMAARMAVAGMLDAPQALEDPDPDGGSDGAD